MTDAPQHPQPEQTAAQGPWGGPAYAYRGAEIRCAKGGHVCGLLMEGHPLHGLTFGVVGCRASGRHLPEPVGHPEQAVAGGHSPAFGTARMWSGKRRSSTHACCSDIRISWPARAALVSIRI